MVKLVLLRHGLSSTNKSKCFCGQYDAPLEPLGHIQAQIVAEYIVKNYKIDCIYSSDLIRVVDTVTPTAQRLGLAIEKSKDLREINIGHWQARLLTEIEKAEPDAFARYKVGDTSLVMGGMESFDMVRERAIKLVDYIAQKHDGKTVLIATHGGVIRMLCEGWLNIGDVEMREKYRITNASITEVDYDNGKANIISIANNSYFDDQTLT